VTRHEMNRFIEAVTGVRLPDRPIHAHWGSKTLCGRIRKRVLSFHVPHSLGLRYVTCDSCCRAFFREGEKWSSDRKTCCRPLSAPT
jgi:hypothetical protein